MPTDTEPSSPRTHGLALGLAFAGGWCISIQSRMNGELSAVLGQPAQAAVYSFGSGLVLLAVATLLSARLRRGIGRIAAGVVQGRLRWWQCLGGLGGACFVAVQTTAVPMLGVAIFSVATVAGQTSNGLLVDRLGIGPGGKRPVRPVRVVTAALAVLGVVVTVSGSFGEGELSPLPVILAVVAGAGVALQQGVNARVNLVSTDVLATTAQNFVIGTGLLLVLMAIEWARGAYTPVPFTGVPWWAWWGGIIGIGFIAAAAWAVQHVGVLVFGLALLSGQLLSALVIDLVFPTPGQAVTGVMVAGVAVTFVAAALAGWFARAGGERGHARSAVTG